MKTLKNKKINEKKKTKENDEKEEEEELYGIVVISVIEVRFEFGKST